MADKGAISTVAVSPVAPETVVTATRMGCGNAYL